MESEPGQARRKIGSSHAAHVNADAPATDTGFLLPPRLSAPDRIRTFRSFHLFHSFREVAAHEPVQDLSSRAFRVSGASACNNSGRTSVA
ncbi:hypothetical protein GCM10015535_39420 [Streptomyces gelaticus]|uniref:Uncharacterized protein n=1 Tax=Streptomyces gelaticus TaxID=285446 RepID=A0ABQ2W0S3_9ACTN|nr:hypothetical protein GCM10015535_39420 [Streptomyces gelaticus]